MIDVRGNNGLDMSETTNDNVIFLKFRYFFKTDVGLEV